MQNNSFYVKYSLKRQGIVYYSQAAELSRTLNMAIAILCVRLQPGRIFMPHY